MCTIQGCGSQEVLPPIIVPETKRRDFVKGLTSLPIAAVLADPVLTAAAAGRGEMKSIKGPDGTIANGYFVKPKTTKPATIILIHEWWGLNDQIKAVANDLAEQGYLAYAIDLYGGKSTRKAEEASRLMDAVDPVKATAMLATAINHFHQFPHSNGKVGTIGWCFGGGWSLNASIAAPVDATVIYYGNLNRSETDLAKLKGPVLGHFAEQDGWINPEMVAGFKARMAKANKADSLQTFTYSADHAFANPTSARYDAKDAALAWQRTLAFFKSNLA
ncbi:MAG TPA: dienelactone hydrolase family protein [Rhizobiales bacterium]|nr:dienelactone hydrolase family protein [Hyphomicrobiales bacterium]